MTGFYPPLGHLSVTLGGLTLSTCAPDPAGSWVIHLVSLEGWDDGIQEEASVVAHPSGDGQVAGLPRLGARRITVRVEVQGVDEFGPRSAAAGVEELARLRSVTLAVSDAARGLSREADVRVLQVQSPMDGDSMLIRTVTLSLVADDPLRYVTGSQALANGANSLINRGGETAWPLLDLTGPHGALTITHPGGSWSLAALAAGVARTVDCRNGAVFNAAGVRVSGTSGPWPRVRPGGAAWTISGLGAGMAYVRRWEAWS